MNDNALDIMLEQIERRQEPYAALSVTELDKGLALGDRKAHEAVIRAAIERYRKPTPLWPLHPGK